MWDASSEYGLSAAAAPAQVGPAAPTAHMSSGDIASGVRGLIDPNNPLVWLGAILALGAGMLGVSGSVRLGRAKASASVGQG